MLNKVIIEIIKAKKKNSFISLVLPLYLNLFYLKNFNPMKNLSDILMTLSDIYIVLMEPHIYITD